MGGDSGQPPAKRVRMGGNGGNSGGVPVPVTYHHQVLYSRCQILEYLLSYYSPPCPAKAFFLNISVFLAPKLLIELGRLFISPKSYPSPLWKIFSLLSNMPIFMAHTFSFPFIFIFTPLVPTGL
jgi:hypothetical protein